MLLYSFHADLLDVLRRLATAARNGDSQNSRFGEKGSMQKLNRRPASEPQQERRAS
jgi:hypothetical protein